MQTIYDDKTLGTIKSNNYCIIDKIDAKEDVIFKASYIVTTGLNVGGKIIALFDLIVLGDLYAKELDVKGQFISLGECEVENNIIVQDRIMSKHIKSKNIESRDEIVAKQIEANKITADGNMIISQTIDVEEMAFSNQKIICGDSVYGSGKMSAYEILVGEEIDLDDGFYSLIKPQKIKLLKDNDKDLGLEYINQKYQSNNDFESYIIEILKNNKENKIFYNTLLRWNKALKEAKVSLNRSKFECYDLGILLSLTEIINCNYFKDWEQINDWYRIFMNNYDKMVKGEWENEVDTFSFDNVQIGDLLQHKLYGVGRVINIIKNDINSIEIAFSNGQKKTFLMGLSISYFKYPKGYEKKHFTYAEKLYLKAKDFAEWISYLSIINAYSKNYPKQLNEFIQEIIYSNIGVKSKFIEARIKENGWE